MHRLTVYATKEDIQAETFVYFKIVQTLVTDNQQLFLRFLRTEKIKVPSHANFSHQNQYPNRTIE